MVKIRCDDFLTAYKGEDFSWCYDSVFFAMEKVFQLEPYSVKIKSACKQFRKNIDKERPDLIEAIEKLGEFNKNEEVDEKAQKKEYVEKFKNIIGSDYIELQPMEYKQEDIIKKDERTK